MGGFYIFDIGQIGGVITDAQHGVRAEALAHGIAQLSGTLSDTQHGVRGSGLHSGIPSPANLLVNGGHEITQRGAGPITATGAYTCDRHQIVLVGGDTLSWTREAANIDGHSLYASACVFVLAAGGGASRHKQRLVIADGYHFLLGTTISFQARRRTATANAVRAVATTDGTGGTSAFSAFHTGGGTYESLSVSPIAVPADATYIDIGTAYAASCTCYEDNDMLVVGSVATSYVGISPAEEWERCQRYYEHHDSDGTHVGPRIGAAYTAGASDKMVYVPWNTPKAVVLATMTKEGTWGVTNAPQPTIDNTASLNGFTIRVIPTGAGDFGAFANAASTGVIGEANP